MKSAAADPRALDWKGNMTRDEFVQAKAFIFSDLERELQLAKADRAALQALGVTPGGGNFLAALGLLCYTEFGGKLRFGFTRADGSDVASANFEYYVKESCTIDMLEAIPGTGIRVEASGHYRFVVESYCRDLRNAFDTLQVHLFGN